MKNIFIVLFLTLVTAISHQSNAQTASTQIMDAKIKFTNSGATYHGVLKLYLTDSQNLQSIDVKIGSVVDSTDLFNQQFNINSLPSGSSLQNNVLSIDMGTFSFHDDYFVVAKLQLTNSDEHQIAFNTNN